MDELTAIKVYEIKASGTFRIKANSPTDAINKAKEFYEDNIGKLNLTWTELDAYQESE